uniref:Uncharacterized protein n=1 Tax=Tanacetum cinerariifolium TaxID=118510 RepID=A0A6L2LF93_TANCI|nr:hypothetical protein [Tanacetum cinerariifolium]
MLGFEIRIDHTFVLTMCDFHRMVEMCYCHIDRMAAMGMCFDYVDVMSIEKCCHIVGVGCGMMVFISWNLLFMVCSYVYSTHVEPSPYTTNPVTIIPGPLGVVHVSSSTCVEPSTSNLNRIRIIPGPAGLVQQARLLKEKIFILDPDGALMSTQQYMDKVVKDVGDDDDFKSAAWVSATNYVNTFGGTVTGCLGDVDNFLKNGKLEQVVGIVKSCSPNMLGNLNVTLKDL